MRLTTHEEAIRTGRLAWLAEATGVREGHVFSVSLHRTVNRLHSDISAVRGGGGRAQEICGVLRAGSTGLILPRRAPENVVFVHLRNSNQVALLGVLWCLAPLSSAGGTHLGVTVTFWRVQSLGRVGLGLMGVLGPRAPVLLSRVRRGLRRFLVGTFLVRIFLHLKIKSWLLIKIIIIKVSNQDEVMRKIRKTAKNERRYLRQDTITVVLFTLKLTSYHI